MSAVSLQVLVVDDEPALRQMLTLMLGRAGYDVEAAASAEEAAARLAKGEFDVVLCDIKLPGMDGIELLRRTRASGSDTAFIMVTAFASMDTAIEALKAGATDYIVKPARNEEILHRLTQLAALRGLKNENRALRRRASRASVTPSPPGRGRVRCRFSRRRPTAGRSRRPSTGRGRCPGRRPWW